MAKLTRRGFAGTLAATASALAAQETKHEITSVSVPSDPIAPQNSEGTLPEALPFAGPIEFTKSYQHRPIRHFAGADVRLLPGVFQSAQDANREFLLDQSPDRLLHVFRVNAGITSNAVPLGGWEKPDCELRGHFVGHYLSACALMYTATRENEFKSRAEYLVAELAKCQAKLQGGYLSAFPTAYFDRLNERKKIWAPFYTIHKIMAGLLDINGHTGSTKALEVLTGMAGWTDKYTASMSEDHLQMVLDTEYGGMNDLLYKLTFLTDDTHFATIGDRFSKKRFFNPLALRRDELRGLHVNTHIPQVIGAAQRYEISGDQRFRDVAEYFWHEVVGTRTYVTGGTSNNEGWLVGPNKLAAELQLGTDTNECCCAYNMLKLTRHLYLWTGDPRYFDYYERTLLNHRLGTINEHGQTQYYLGIAPGAWRTFGTKYDSFWCCTGTGAEEFSKLAGSIYFNDREGVFVNLFVASELNWRDKGFRLRQETKFPEEAATAFIIDVVQPTSLSLRLRIPSWLSSSPTVLINGKPSELSASPGSYLTIKRTWSKGDRVEMRLPMDLRYEAMPDDPNLRAVLYGPLVLAGGLGREGLTEAMQIGPGGPEMSKKTPPHIPQFHAAGKQAAQWIKQEDTLRFRADNVALRPFYQVSGERYSVYWRLT